MPHPTRQVPACVNCKYAVLHGVDPSRLRCDHLDSPVDVISGLPDLCKYGRGEVRFGGWCGADGRLFEPADSDGSSVQSVGKSLGRRAYSRGLDVGGQ